MRVPRDQPMQTARVACRHVGHDFDAPMRLQILAVMIGALVQFLFLGQRLKLDHRKIAAGLESVVLIEHVSDTARHAGCEVSAGASEYNDNTSGHVFAAMIAGALHHDVGARIAHSEAFARDAAEIALALDRSVKDGVADDNRLFRHNSGIGWRPYYEAPARKTLANIVIAFAVKFEGDATR